MALPQLIDPFECLAQRRTISGVLSSQQLPRLNDLLDASTEDIQFELSFTADEQSRCIVHCHVTANMPVVCQRCGQPFELPLEIKSQLCVVENDDLAKQLPAVYEPLVTDSQPVVLIDIVEEELLLAMPMAPRHAERACPQLG